MNSIRRRLLLWQSGSLVAVAALASVLTYGLAWTAFNRIRDYGLEQVAHSIVRHGLRSHGPFAAPPRRPAAGASVPDGAAAPAMGEPAPPTATGPATGAEVGQPEALPTDVASGEAEDGGDADLGQFVSQIWRSDGRLVYASVDDVGPPMQPPGFHLVDWQGERWRVYALGDRQQVVQVAVTSANRVQAFAELVPWLLAPMAALVVVLALLLQLASARALRPLARLRQEIAGRDVTTLHAVPTAGLPAEVAPVGEALNQLMSRIDDLLRTQRGLIADVAHELNTPLAAVKLQAQLARRASDAERSAMLDRLDEGIERAIHLARQLLQLARLEADARPLQPMPLRLDLQAAAVVGAMSARADAQGIDLGLAAAEPAIVVVDMQDLRVLLENLLDNALRHAPRGSAVDVGVRVEDGAPVLSVVDRGPGIPAADRERVRQRFVRLDGGDATGSGLGLAIVDAIVTQAGGRLQMRDTPGGGLTVCVEWPAVAGGTDAVAGGDPAAGGPTAPIAGPSVSPPSGPVAAAPVDGG